jgi:hypothetical protein
MSYYSVAAVFMDEVVFHRDTPLENGVNGLVIEASSKLMKIADDASEIDDDGYVIVEQYWEHYSEPEIVLILMMEEVEEVLHQQYATEWAAQHHTHHAESAATVKGKVRTMSGKPHKSRKLTLDQGISPEEAAKRIALKSETDSSWAVKQIDTYDTIYGTRIDGKLYNHSTGESAEFTDAEIEPPYVVENMWDDFFHEDYEEDVDCLCDSEHLETNKECPWNDAPIPEIATSKDSEEEAYAYAYNVGHINGRKKEPYKPNPENKDTAEFRKIYKQRAENTWNPTFESENKVFKSPLDDKYREIL